METNMTSGNTKKPMVHKILSVLVTLIGAALLVFMITQEGEPGAVPLIMITAGIGWFLASGYYSRSRQA